MHFGSVIVEFFIFDIVALTFMVKFNVTLGKCKKGVEVKDISQIKTYINTGFLKFPKFPKYCSIQC